MHAQGYGMWGAGKKTKEGGEGKRDPSTNTGKKRPLHHTISLS